MASADDPPLQIFLRESSCYENGPARAGATKSSASYGRPTKAKARCWRKKKRPRHIGGRPGPFQIGVRSVGERTEPPQSVCRRSGSNLMLEFVPCPICNSVALIRNVWSLCNLE